MSEERKEKPRRIIDSIENLVDDVGKVVGVAVIHGSEAATSVGETLKDTIKDTIHGARAARDSVVMIRVEKDSLARLDDLVESGLAHSRSEAAAFLIREGVKSRRDLFEKIAVKIEEIRKAKEDLRLLLDEDLEQDEQSPPEGENKPSETQDEDSGPQSEAARP